MDRRSFLAGSVAAVAASGFANAWGADEIRVGAPLPLTGPLAPEGRKQKRGYDFNTVALHDFGGPKVIADEFGKARQMR